MKLTPEEARDFHAAAKLIETDGVNGYRTCCERFGKKTANQLIIAYLRLTFNPEKQWPAPENLEEQVNNTLITEGIMEKDDLRMAALKGILEQPHLNIDQKAELIMELICK